MQRDGGGSSLCRVGDLRRLAPAADAADRMSELHPQVQTHRVQALAAILKTAVDRLATEGEVSNATKASLVDALQTAADAIVEVELMRESIDALPQNRRHPKGGYSFMQRALFGTCFQFVSEMSHSQIFGEDINDRGWIEELERRGMISWCADDDPNAVTAGLYHYPPGGPLMKHDGRGGFTVVDH